MTNTKADKGQLTVSAMLGEPVAQRVPLFVELIGVGSKGYARALVGEEIPVAPGEYFVQLTLPDGSRVTADERARVVAGESRQFDFPLSLTTGLSTEVTTPPTPADAQAADVASAPAPTMLNQDVEVVRRRFAAGSAITKDAVAIKRTKRLWRGDWAEVWMNASPPGTTELVSRLVRQTQDVAAEGGLRVQRGTEPTTVLVLVYGSKASAFVIPFDEQFGVPLETSVSWRAMPAAEVGLVRPSLDYDLGSTKTNAFLSFVRRGERAVARDLSLRGLLEQAEALAYGKSESPLGAVLGLYVLLRINGLDGLEDWTRNLYDFFPWLPDTLAIRVEYLARSGEHRHAVELLRHADLRGGPWFRSGMNYLLDRLGLYLEIEAEERAEIGITPERQGDLSPSEARPPAPLPLLGSVRDHLHVPRLARRGDNAGFRRGGQVKTSDIVTLFGGGRESQPYRHTCAWARGAWGAGQDTGTDSWHRPAAS